MTALLNDPRTPTRTPTPSPTRPRRRDSKPPVRVLWTGGLTIVVIIVLSAIALRSVNGLPGVHYDVVYAQVPDPGDLQPHSDVRIGGVRVGEVISVAAAGTSARIEMKLTRAGSLPVDTGIVIRGQGLLGQRYVELLPGKASRQLANGATIHGNANSLTYGLPDVLNTFDPKTRSGLSSTLNGLGTGLLSRGSDLNSALAVGPIPARDFLRLTAAMLSRTGAAGRLLPSLSSAATALDDARGSLTGMLAPGAAALDPLVRQAADLSATLEQSPPTLTQATAGLQRAQSLVNAAHDLANAANLALPDAPGGLAAATVLLASSHQPLEQAALLLKDAIPTVPAALLITSSLEPVLSPARELVTALDPLVGVVGQNGCGIYNFVSNWRSTLGYGVPNGTGAALPSGHIGPLNDFRITLIAGPDSVAGVASPPGSLGHKDVYPAPCSYAPGPRYLAVTGAGQ